MNSPIKASPHLNVSLQPKKKTKTKYTNSMKSYRSLCSKEQQWECRTEPTKRGTENNRIIITILSAQGLMGFFFPLANHTCTDNLVTWKPFHKSDTMYQHSSNFKRIQTSDVVTMARIVPTGMDFCASLRSPDLFEPAMIPESTFW